VTRLVARRVDLYLDTLYSAFEMIASGITTVQHLHDTSRCRPLRYSSAVLRFSPLQHMTWIAGRADRDGVCDLGPTSESELRQGRVWGIKSACRRQG
jgi:hypothetical protein